MGAGYYHVLMIGFVSCKKPKESMMASFKKSSEDNIEMTRDVATKNVSIIISCVMEKRQQFDGDSLCKV